MLSMLNRMFLQLLPATLIAVLLFQLSSGQETSPLVTGNPAAQPEPVHIASPLSAFNAAAGTPEYFSVDIPAERVVTHRINLGGAIAYDMASRNCSSAESIKQVAASLAMVPMGSERIETPFVKQAVYQLETEGNFVITATQDYFNNLGPVLNRLQYGNQQFVIETRFLIVPYEMDVNEIYNYVESGSVETFGTQLPPMTTVANASDPGDENLRDDMGTFAMATQKTSRSCPTLMARLSEQNTLALIEVLKRDARISITQAPTVKTYPNSSAVINDCSMRPFVVDVEKTRTEQGVLVQPVIQTLEEGVKLVISASIVDGKMRLQGDLAFSEITDVKTRQYPAIEETQSIAIQVPEHQVRTIHWSTDAEPGQTILINPVEPIERTVQEKGRFRTKTIVEESRQLILIRATVVDGK